jgi:hypothetical protein
MVIKDSPAHFSIELYGKKVTTTLPTSELTIDEVYDVLSAMTIASGFHAETWQDHIIEKAFEYRERPFPSKYFEDDVLNDKG